MKILVATDGSTYSDYAVNFVANQKWPEGSEIRVISVLEHSALESVSAGEYALKLNEMREHVRDIIKYIASSAADIIASKEHKVSYTTREGVAAEEIIDEAKDWRADLVVVGTHGRRGLTKFLLGSVAQRIAVHAPCSVEIVRKPKETSE